VIQGVEEDLQRTRAELERLKQHKEQSVKKLIEMFEQTMKSFQVEDKAIDLKAREEAVKTLRKLPVYGYNNNGAYVPDYEWPTA